MMRALKILGITAATILALLLGAAVLVNVISGEQYKELIGSLVQSALPVVI